MTLTIGHLFSTSLLQVQMFKAQCTSIKMPDMPHEMVRFSWKKIISILSLILICLLK